jgi:hypothetical protein
MVGDRIAREVRGARRERDRAAVTWFNPGFAPTDVTFAVSTFDSVFGKFAISVE